MLANAVMNGDTLFNLAKFCLAWLKNDAGYSIKHLLKIELLSGD